MAQIPLRSRQTPRSEELLRALERDARFRITRGPANEDAITVEVPDVDNPDDAKRMLDAALLEADSNWGDYLRWERAE